MNKRGVDAVYLHGDYSMSLKKAQEMKNTTDNGYNGKYNPLSNNCLHYVIEILRYGDNIYDGVDSFVQKDNTIIPYDLYGMLRFTVIQCGGEFEYNYQTKGDTYGNFNR